MLLCLFNLVKFLICGLTVGGGSAGAALANRLSEDQSASVLLVEAGGIENEVSDIPLIAATLQLSPLDWQYVTEPQDASCFGFSDRVRIINIHLKLSGVSNIFNTNSAKFFFNSLGHAHRSGADQS